MLENVIKKLFPIRDENNQPCTFPTFASQVFFNDGSVLEGKEFGSGNDIIDPLTIYPVGSIYMSVNETSPASLFGGTWEQLKDRFLLGAGDSYAAGSEGGEAAHALNVDEMPKHQHNVFAKTSNSVLSSGTADFFAMGTTWQYTQSTEKGGIMIDTAGNNQPHNNMPPYLAVYMWKRVS